MITERYCFPWRRAKGPFAIVGTIKQDSFARAVLREWLFVLTVGMVTLVCVALPASAEMTVPDGEYIVFHHRDSLGTTIAQTDHHGNLLGGRSTLPYGSSLARRAPDGGGYPDNVVASTRTQDGYTGHVEERHVGLTYMRARHYDPELGRFLSNDPVGFNASNPASFSRYAYGNNNPYKYVDPDGRWAFLAYAFTPPGQAALVAAGQYTAGALTGALIGIGLYEANKNILNNESDDGSADDGIPDDWNDARGSPSPRDVPISDLNPLHPRDTVGPRPDLSGLTDEELLEAARNPNEPGTGLKVNERGKLVDGNSRAYELIDRANDPSSSITPDTTVPVEDYKSGDWSSWD